MYVFGHTDVAVASCAVVKLVTNIIHILIIIVVFYPIKFKTVIPFLFIILTL